MANQSPLDLVQLFETHPAVFDAYHARVMGLLSQRDGAAMRKQGFRERREATRAERIRKAGRRR